MTDDRRHHIRIAFQSPAELVFPDRTLVVVVLDLSLKGALIKLPPNTTIEPNAICMLHVHLGDAAVEDNISLEARVAHVSENHAGLLCVTIDLDSVTHLRRLVELNLGDAGLLERELSMLIAE